MTKLKSSCRVKTAYKLYRKAFIMSSRNMQDFNWTSSLFCSLFFVPKNQSVTASENIKGAKADCFDKKIMLYNKGKIL